jgi:hypothetical protein
VAEELKMKRETIKIEGGRNLYNYTFDAPASSSEVERERSTNKNVDSTKNAEPEAE